MIVVTRNQNSSVNQPVDSSSANARLRVKSHGSHHTMVPSSANHRTFTSAKAITTKITVTIHALATICCSFHPLNCKWW